MMDNRNTSDICYEFEINIIDKKHTTISEHTEIYNKIERMLNYPYIEICNEIGIAVGYLHKTRARSRNAEVERSICRPYNYS